MNSTNRIAWTFVVLALLLIVGVDLRVAAERSPQTLELEVGPSSVNSSVQVYFDLGSGYHESDSSTADVVAGLASQRLAFPLPAHPVHALRLDPLMTAGSLVITSARIVTPAARSGVPLDLRRLKPVQEINQLSTTDRGAVTIVTSSGSTDSQCSLALDSPVGGSLTGTGLFLKLLPLDVSILFIYLLLVMVAWFVTEKTPVGMWQSWRSTPQQGRLARGIMALGSILVLIYVWLLWLNLGRSPLVPQQEPSWVAVMTYAIAHRWQFGKDVILTYGPTMPLTICSYIGSIDTTIFVGRLLCKAWSLVLVVWLGRRLTPGRRWAFWLLAVALLGGFSEPACFEVTIVAAGLLFARYVRAERWLLVPTLLYVTTIALVKVTFLLYVVIMLVVVGTERLWRRQWAAAFVPAALFALCFTGEWWLLGQHLANLPAYLHGSLELVSGFSQAMSEPPEALMLILGLITAALTIVQLALFLPYDRPHRWIDLSMIGLLAGGLLLAWKQGFVRADYHLVDWIVYAVVSAAMVPAFFPAVNRQLEAVCFGLVVLVSITSLMHLDPAAAQKTASLFEDRWRSALHTILHPVEAARAQKQAVLQNRLAYSLPQVKKLVGDHTVDVFCDEQAIAILNGLNFKPRPSFLSYSTYTAWLMNLDLAFYCSADAPDFVLFKLESIDNRLPTLQNAPLLIVLARFYKPVLSENGYSVFKRQEHPNLSGTPANFPLLTEGECSLDARLPIPVNGSVWCQLDMRETPKGKLLKMLYQQPKVMLNVTRANGQTEAYRLVPPLGPQGFLINPLPVSTEDCLRWMAGLPLPTVASIQLANASQLSPVFKSQMHYKFYSIPAWANPPE